MSLTSNNVFTNHQCSNEQCFLARLTLIMYLFYSFPMDDDYIFHAFMHAIEHSLIFISGFSAVVTHDTLSPIHVT